MKSTLLIFTAVALFSAAGCSSKEGPKPDLRVLLDSGPIRLNPRSTTDAIGQQMNALLYRGLTRKDVNMDPQPDLAESWIVSPDKKKWVFRIRDGAFDHEGQPITAAKMAECLEQYRTGKPVSTYVPSLPSWTGTEAHSKEVILHLNAPDPYLPRNILALRYFRVPGAAHPCTEPDPNKPLIGSGIAKLLNWSPMILDEHSFDFEVIDEKKIVRFEVVQDENTRVLKLIEGDVDAAYNAISLSKERWFMRYFSDRYRMIERAGNKVSYLAFNLRDPLLSRVEVRRAISMSIDRESVVRDKMYGFGAVADNILSPTLPEYLDSKFDYSPEKAEKILDQAGLARGKDGVRFALKFKCTNVREGMDQARIFQEMLGKVGIDLQIDVVEQAVFLSSIQKGSFQLYSSRWIGVGDGSILNHIFHTGFPGNRGKYSDPEVDKLLDRAMIEVDFPKRKELLDQVQRIVARDLPVFPLWYWSNSIILKKELKGLSPDEISLSGALEPALKLRY